VDLYPRPRLAEIAMAIATTHKKILSVYALAGYGAAMYSARITYASRVDATPEGELAALAVVYAFILDCHVRRKGAEQSARNDAKETHHARARSILPR
jgi:hypothetical protein